MLKLWGRNRVKGQAEESNPASAADARVPIVGYEISPGDLELLMQHSRMALEKPSMTYTFCKDVLRIAQNAKPVYDLRPEN